jgi:hypothetical protein
MSHTKRIQCNKDIIQIYRDGSKFQDTQEAGIAMRIPQYNMSEQWLPH